MSETQRHIDKPEPRWQALLAFLAVGAIYLALPRDLAAAYTRLLETVRELEPLSGFCYTQFTDTYQEANGLLYMDRTPKFPLDEMARATRGALGGREARAEEEWEKLVSAAPAAV